MSDSVWLHRWQSTRLACHLDSPGKNTGVGCHFLLQCMKVKSESEVAQLCLTLSNPMDCSLSGSSVHGIFQARILPTKYTPWHNSAHQRGRTQYHAPVGRNQSLPPKSLHKPFRQPHPPKDKQQKEEELQSWSLQNRNHNHRMLDKMRWQRNISWMKEEDKILEE